jgi:2,5-diketo-D-gluconate reductase A
MLRTTLALAAAATASALVPTVQLCTPPARPNHACYPMPILGAGSCCGSYNISSWLAAGGRHIDTSVDYGSQPDIAAAIQASGIPREQLWITSKLNVESCATNMSQALFDLVLAPLQTSYLDLLLLHHAGRWETDNDPRPACWDPTLAGTLGSYYHCRMDTIQAFEDMRAAGFIRAWGVSNWQERDLQQMFDAVGYFPAINQIEFHPYWQDHATVAFCNRHGILVEAYAPYGDGARSGMLNNTMWAPIAATHGATVGQTVLRYELQTGADIVIPRSHSPAHQLDNLALFDSKGDFTFSLNQTEVANMSSVNVYRKVYHTDCQRECGRGARAALRGKRHSRALDCALQPPATPLPSPCACFLIPAAQPAHAPTRACSVVLKTWRDILSANVAGLRGRHHDHKRH